MLIAGGVLKNSTVSACVGHNADVPQKSDQYIVLVHCQRPATPSAGRLPGN